MKAFAFVSSLVLIIFFLWTNPGLVQTHEDDDTWKPYMQYFDPMRRAWFTCLYDASRVLSRPGTDPTVEVFEKLVPRNRLQGKEDEGFGALSDVTSEYEILCGNRTYRVLQTFSHHGDKVRFALDPSPWSAPEPGSREEQLIRTVCGPPTSPEH